MTDWEDTIAPEWEEPRGPHLPDTLTRVPLAVWPFVALAIALCYLELQRYGPNATGSASDLVPFAISLTPVVAAPLSGAALFLRHPHAWSRHRPLAIALILLTAAVSIRFFTPVISDLVTPTGPLVDPYAEIAPNMWFSFVFGKASSVMSLFGLAYLWLGLDLERREARSPASRWIFVVLATGAVVMAIVLVPSQIALGEISGDPLYPLIGAVEIAFSLIGGLAWAAVATVAVDGARMGERPRSAWWLVAVAALGASVLAFGVQVILTLMVTVLGENVVLAWLWLGHGFATDVALLAAFALGLPSTDAVEEGSSEAPIPNE
jgi:hypothetical protein